MEPHRSFLDRLDERHPTWIRLKATVDTDPTLFPAEYLEQERKALGEHAFKREYLGIPVSGAASPFTWELYARVTNLRGPSMPPGPAFGLSPAAAAGPSTNPFRDPDIARSSPMTAISIDPRLWPRLHPLLIAHDVGGSRDRSTAVVGGYCGYAPGILGIKEFSELPQDLYGSMRASALAQVDAPLRQKCADRRDLSNNSSYGEQLLETFGPRVIGVHIGPRGDGMTFERRPVGRGCLPIYHVGRSHLLEALHSDLQAGRIRFADGRRHGALMPNWKPSSPKYGRAGSSINVYRGSTMISASPAPCSIGRPVTPIWSCG